MKPVPVLAARAAILFALAGFPAANAGNASLIHPQPLLAQPDLFALPLVWLDRNAPVEVLERRGGWAKARAGHQEGWLRILALREQPARLPTSQNIADLFRPGATDYDRVTAIAGFRGVPLARPSSHALILTIGEYGNGIPRLAGVVHDAASAALMARALGVPEANTTVLKDAALTLAGMRTALDDLEKRVLPNDEVFLYYSGHGTRLPAFDGRAARCAEALVTVDGQALMDSELQDRLARIAEKARRVVVFLDSCHSGGALTRDVGTDGLSGKFWAKEGGDTCDRPSNVLVRGLADARPGQGRLNFIHIAAARDDEVALDAPGGGGLASQAWLDCLAGAARDRDGSAGLSAAELAVCAQPRIERLAQGNTRFAPHHLTLAGNTGMVLSRSAPPDAATPEPEAAGDAAATLRDIFANRDDRRTVKLAADQPAYRVKRDRVGFTLTSSHEGYVYLLMVGSDGKSFDLLFPNRKDDRNHILAGETWKLPRAGWTIRAGGPAGRDHLLALVSDNPRDFSALGLVPAGPFSMLAATPQATRDILFVSDTSEHAGQDACLEPGPRRTLEIANACSDAYGADLITLEEIE